VQAKIHWQGFITRAPLNLCWRNPCNAASHDRSPVGFHQRPTGDFRTNVQARRRMKVCHMFPSPTRMFLTMGVGVHRHALAASSSPYVMRISSSRTWFMYRPFFRRACEVITREAASNCSSPGISRSACQLSQRPTNLAAVFSPASVSAGRPTRGCMIHFGAAWIRHGRGSQRRAGRGPGRDHARVDARPGF
jgi:hypothetical protein